MAHKESFGRRLAILLGASLAFSLGVAIAQTPASQPADLSAGAQVSRLAGDWRSTAAVAVPFSQPPAASSDLGVTPSGTRLERMLLLLSPSSDEQTALTAELANQQNSASSEYHHWLTPSEFAAAYANSAADVAAVSGWLEAQGFQVAPLPASRGWIEFSGTAAQVEQTFHTQVHFVATLQGTRAALVSGISVPAALLPLVDGLVSLDGGLSTPALTTPRPVAVSAAELAARTSPNSAEALTPQLAAQLLHLDALHTAGVLGAGESIAIPTRSNVRASDIAAFRSVFSLPVSPLAVLPNGPDPGRTADESEAVLAASWAGAAAPGAQIVLVPAANTGATDGLDLALASVVDQALAHTVSVGYSACEASLSAAHQAFYAALYQQAAAEGMAVVAAVGDSGPSACQAAGSEEPVTSGYAVNALASTPWNTAAGVASFGSGGPAAGASVLSAWSPANPADPAYAGGGGKSALYPAPAWQPIPDAKEAETGSAPATNHRLLPDLALPTALDNGVNRGLAFCLSGSTASSGCTLVRSGGSSASAAIFAGIAALVAEKYGPQGNLAPNLYTLSGRSGIFSDVAQGSAQLSCQAGTPGCGPTGQIGFAAAEGYDLATGLGVANAQTLVSQWSASPAVGTGGVNVFFSITPQNANFTYNPSAAVTLKGTVLSKTGGGVPTGSVTFINTTTNQALSSTASANLNGSGVAALALNLNTVLQGVGSYNVAAQYNGDSNYEVLTSAATTINVEQSFTVLTVVPSDTKPVAGESITVTVTAAVSTASGPPAGANAPTGLITLNLADGPQAYSYYANLSTANGVTTAVFNITVPTALGVASYALQAIYAGDGNYNGSTSASVPLTLSKTATSSSISSATTTNPYAYSPWVLSATITASSTNASQPTGTFTFLVDGAAQVQAPVTSGSPSTATLTIAGPAVGSHTLSGTYNGDANFSASTAPSVSVTSTATPTTLALTPSPASPAPGTALQLTAILTPLYTGAVAPTGQVTFTLDGTSQGSAPLTAGSVAVLSITAPSAGAHTLLATYAGDTNYGASTSPAVPLMVAKVSTTLAIAPATTTPTVGSSLLVSATITAASSGATKPSGTVAFTLDGVSAGTGTVTPGSPSTASVTLTAVTPGTHVLQATYSGDSYYNTSIAAAVNIVVAKAPTTIVITPATITPTAGGSLQVTANITSSSPGTVLPSGTVNFALDGVSQGVEPVTAGSPSTATINLPLISAGSHVLIGTYSGDNYYGTSTSPAIALAVAKGGTTTTVTATPATLTIGSTETLTATIAPVSALTGTIYTLTGTVTFYDGGTTILGRAAVTSNVASLTGVALSGSANHSITAVYSGDLNWQPSASVPILLVAITQPDTVLLTANLSTAQPGQTVVLTATVTPATIPSATGEQNPSGTVVFYSGTTVLGQTALVPVPLTFASTATLTLATLPGGQDTVYAIYLGDLYYDTETSNLLTLTIQDFTITPSPTNPATNLTIVKGTSGTASFVITGLGGFNNEIQVVCAVPSQDDMTCTATPQQLIPTGTVTFVVQTFASGSTTAANRAPRPLWPRAAGGTALALLAGFFLLPFGRRASIFARISTQRLLILVLLLVGLGGAGICCSNSTVTQPASGGTPLGVATLKITASAYVDNAVLGRSVYLTVNVVAPGSTTTN
jgi:hypothetical protein